MYLYPLQLHYVALTSNGRDWRPSSYQIEHWYTIHIYTICIQLLIAITIPRSLRRLRTGSWIYHIVGYSWLSIRIINHSSWESTIINPFCIHLSSNEGAGSPHSTSSPMPSAQQTMSHRRVPATKLGPPRQFAPNGAWVAKRRTHCSPGCALGAQLGMRNHGGWWAGWWPRLVEPFTTWIMVVNDWGLWSPLNHELESCGFTHLLLVGCENRNTNNNANNRCLFHCDSHKCLSYLC